MEGLRQRVAVVARDERQVLTLEPDHQTLLACTAVPGATLESLGLALEQLRGLTARERVRAVLALDQGFRLEDAAAVALAVPAGHDAAAFTRWLSRRLARETPVEIVHGPGDGLALAAAIRAREGFAPGRIRYARGPNGRIRLEAFEFHVAEHCNLRCANCCNMSPLVGRAFLSVAELEDLCRRVGDAIEADVLKIMGGEALDELTISHYSSAPVPPRALAREQSARYGFVLNVKPVGEFSQVLSPRFDRDDEQVRRTYARCWLRHRCIVVRRGRFYMCTRAAYAHFGGNHVAGGEVDDVAGDEPVDRHLLGGPAVAHDAGVQAHEQRQPRDRRIGPRFLPKAQARRHSRFGRAQRWVGRRRPEEMVWGVATVMPPSPRILRGGRRADLLAKRSPPVPQASSGFFQRRPGKRPKSVSFECTSA